MLKAYGRVYKINDKFNQVEFSPIFREETVEDFNVICNENYVDLLTFSKLAKDINDFLVTKTYESDNYAKIYYTRLFNIRVRDHFFSAFILISQGFLVDAISLTRSALEDLLVIINFYIDKNFFDGWYLNKNDFKIKPFKLRENIRNSDFFDIEDGKFFDNVYRELCNIMHPNKDSVDVTREYHPSFKNLNPEKLKKYTNLITLAYYTYELQLCIFLEGLYPDNNNDIKIIKESLKSDINVKHLVDEFSRSN